MRLIIICKPQRDKPKSLLKYPIQPDQQKINLLMIGKPQEQISFPTPCFPNRINPFLSEYLDVVFYLLHGIINREETVEIAGCREIHPLFIGAAIGLVTMTIYKPLEITNGFSGVGHIPSCMFCMRFSHHGIFIVIAIDICLQRNLLDISQ